MAVTSLPPTSPDPQSQVPAKRAPLTSDEFAKLSALLQHVNAEGFTVPDTVKEARDLQKKRAKASKDPKSWVGKPLLASGGKPLSDREKHYLSTEQCQRFLRATKWDLGAAISRTEETLSWRREFGVDAINDDPSIVEEEAKTGKEVVLGWDVQKRPCLYMFPWRQNTKQSHRQIQFVVWTLERAVDLMGPNVENLCLLIDFGSGEHGGGQPTSLGQAKKVLDILQNYYCERLGRAVCINVPTIFWGFYRLVSPFVDPVTKDKIRFNPDTRTLVPPSQLDKEIFGGDYDFVYKHEEYYSYLDQMCRKRREEQFARWQQFGGGKAGLSEFMSKGGMEEARDGAARAEAAEDAKKQAQALPSGADAGGAAGMAPAAMATSGEAASRPQSSYAPSTKSSGYREPPEAATAADWVEPPSDTTPPSSVHTGASPTISGGHGGHASSHDQDVLDSVPRSATRPRGASNDSFVTSREDLATTPQPSEAQLPSIGQQQNAPAPASANGHGDAGVDSLSTGVKGMVIKPDGSIGFA